MLTLKQQCARYNGKRLCCAGWTDSPFFPFSAALLSHLCLSVWLFSSFLPYIWPWTLGPFTWLGKEFKENSSRLTLHWYSLGATQIAPEASMCRRLYCAGYESSSDQAPLA